MFAVDVLVRVPLSGEEGVLLADDLSVEECGQLKWDVIKLNTDLHSGITHLLWYLPWGIPPSVP